MAHFAKVQNGKVINVIVAEQDFIDSYEDGIEGEWIQTSYNTHGGIHSLGGAPLRKNYAGIGFTYDKELDAFIPPQRFPSWILNIDTCLWEPPIPMPEDNTQQYDWNEGEQVWLRRLD